ncbi:MAG: SH3 domain-containing protein [Methylotenera sp.]|uniref:SH3 domain-containing protein n=1 Tax=Methylotenera sp. TaxID=2051956 RepID=UPI00182819D3|nr:SH3 domain-containing protein [Methylotenera sp.]NOU25361.1 SH3 domain-containing protein [Methylotenera sp.]
MRTLTRLLIAASFPALLLANLSIAAATGSALKNDNLRYEPFADAKVTGTLNRGETLEILNKKGAWLQVKSKKTIGWVRLLSVKRGASSSSNQAAGALAVASGRAGTGQVVSTTGIRGLSAEELKAAKFNETEVKTLESYTQSANQGKQFANAGGLHTVSFTNLTAVPGGSK